jgi:hypothetical protein
MHLVIVAKFLTVQISEMDLDYSLDPDSVPGASGPEGFAPEPDPIFVKDGDRRPSMLVSEFRQFAARKLFVDVQFVGSDAKVSPTKPRTA